MDPARGALTNRKFQSVKSVPSVGKTGLESDVTPPSRGHRGRSLLPPAVREQAYEWHPGRARRWRRFPGLQHVPQDGRIVLTLDDGPDRDATPAVLDALDGGSVRATFFVLGTQVLRYPELARETLDRGHEIGLHGYAHERHDRISAERSHEDVLRGHAAVADTLGVGCRWYRPPYGRMSAGALRACRELEMELVYWSAWGIDWEDNGPARIARKAAEQLDDGSILLLHDSARFGRRPSALPTARAIPLIAEHAATRGLGLVCLQEAMELEPVA
jgi:peptidoglycan-N-acetylglucosamine deacetylase